MLTYDNEAGGYLSIVQASSCPSVLTHTVYLSSHEHALEGGEEQTFTSAGLCVLNDCFAPQKFVFVYQDA